MCIRDRVRLGLVWGKPPSASWLGNCGESYAIADWPLRRWNHVEGRIVHVGVFVCVMQLVARCEKEEADEGAFNRCLFIYLFLFFRAAKKWTSNAGDYCWRVVTGWRQGRRGTHSSGLKSWEVGDRKFHYSEIKKIDR